MATGYKKRTIKVGEPEVIAAGLSVALAMTLAFGLSITADSLGPNRELLAAIIWGVALVGFPLAVLTCLLGRLVGGHSASATGVAGALWGLYVFLLPRLWIALDYLRGETSDDVTLGAFWVFAWIAFLYLPALVSALVLPASLRWAVFLVVAAITQLAAFAPGFGVLPQVAFVSTVLLILAARMSFWSWREEQRV